MGYTKEKRLVNNQLGINKKQQAIPAGEQFNIPNHSGDHSAGRVDTTPTQDLDLVNKKYVDAQFPVTHASTTGQTTDDHHTQSHNIASHSDTTATGTELNTLTDNSMADTLHRHSELSASDGTPDPALSVDVDGNVNIANDLLVEENLTCWNIINVNTLEVTTAFDVQTGMHNSLTGIVVVNDDLDVVGDITVSGTVDGVDVAAFKTTYDAHDHSAADPTQVDHVNLLNKGTYTHAEIDTHISDYPPVGTITMFGGAAAPTGYLLCDGSAVSRTVIYGGLFLVIGTTYGVGDGSTTFNIPDMRGIFPRGAGVSGKLDNANGAAFTGTLGTYQNDKMQGHYHYTRWKNHPDTLVNAGGINPGAAISASGAVTHAGALQAKEPIADGTNGPPRIGAETNPANLGLTFIIKY